LTVGAVERAARVRRGAGLFALADRGILRVEGGDRRRWLDGMLSNDVGRLAPGPGASGCYALLLSPKGRILADLHVLLRGEAYWLELEGGVLADVRTRLERYVIADDVRLDDDSADWTRFALEGPRAPSILETACGATLGLSPEAGCDATLGGTPIVVAAYGWSGDPGFQLFVPRAEAPAVREALCGVGGADLVEGDRDTLEILRIEAGIPRLGAELDEDVFPAEAGLVARAVSLTKGCFTGQEIVARLESRGQVNHRLVGLRFEGTAAPTPGEGLDDGDGKRVGEVTSGCVSPGAGVIGLGYVRRTLALAGTALRAGSRSVEVADLPLVAPGAPDAG
jgi:folate-binding protein YgfZ